MQKSNKKFLHAVLLKKGKFKNMNKKFRMIALVVVAAISFGTTSFLHGDVIVDGKETENNIYALEVENGEVEDAKNYETETTQTKYDDVMTVYFKKETSDEKADVTQDTDIENINENEEDQCEENNNNENPDENSDETDEKPEEATHTPEPRQESSNNLPDYNVGSMELEILELVNEYRAENGIEPLELNDTLCSLASIRAKEASIKWSHERPNGTRYYSVFMDYNVTWASYVGENLGCRFSSAKQIVDAWIASDGHRANLLDDKFNNIGMAIFIAEDNTMYIAQIFAD